MPPTLPFHPGAPRRASSLGGTTNPLARSSRAAARAPELDELRQPAKEQALTEALTRLGAGREVTRPFDASLDLARGPRPGRGISRLGGRSRDRGAPHSGGVRAIRAVSRRPGLARRRRAARRGAARERHRAALHASGRGDGARARRAQRRRSSRPPRRARRSATTRRSSTSMLRDPARARCTCFRPRRSRRTSSPSSTACPSSSAARRRSACSPTTATRRPTRGARSGRARTSCSATRTCCTPGILPHHPRWAKLFENLRYVVIDELHAYRGVFGSHLAQRAAAAAAHLPALRLRSDVHLLVGDDRQSGGARRAAHRAADRRWWTRAARRAARSSSCSSTRRSSISSSGIRRSYLSEARRVALEFLQAQAAVDRVRAEPPRDRDPHDVPEGCVRGPARRRRRGCAAIAAAICRKRRREIERGLREGGVRARGLDQRARTGHRHRRARRVGDGRLSGHDCRDLAARGARGTAEPDGRRRCSWRRARRSISSWCGIRRTSSTRRPSTR